MGFTFQFKMVDKTMEVKPQQWTNLGPQINFENSDKSD